ncbi:MAG: hypothetical protein JXQ29_02165 [Planctomycetes bacterium]|nr:hypothetical protein [Planctomycetota bacterium]
MTGAARPGSAPGRRWRRAGLVAGALVTALALAEVALRCLDFPADLEQEWLLLPEPVRKRVFDAETLLANPEFEDDQHYRTAPGKKTLVVLGDSFAVGHHVGAAEGFVDRLGEMLRAAGVEVTIINMGMGYAGNDQHLALLQHKVLARLRPDLVLWQLCYNDFWENVELSLYRLDDAGGLVPHGIDWNWLYVRERIGRCLPGPLAILKRTYLCRLVLNATKRLRMAQVPVAYRDDPLEYGRRKGARIVEEMVRLARKNGFPLLAVQVAPQAVHLLREATPPDALPEWCGRCFAAQKAMIADREHYIDAEFTPEDLALVNAQFGTRISSIGHGLFLDGERDQAALGTRHYNRYGHWLFARKIGQYLCAHRVPLLD